MHRVPRRLQCPQTGYVSSHLTRLDLHSWQANLLLGRERAGNGLASELWETHLALGTTGGVGVRANRTRHCLETILDFCWL